jgi:hypothetical protein
MADSKIPPFVDLPAIKRQAREVPSEFVIAEKWDTIVENAIKQGAIGLVAGTFTGLLLARTSILGRFRPSFCTLIA